MMFIFFSQDQDLSQDPDHDFCLKTKKDQDEDFSLLDHVIELLSSCLISK